VAELVPMSELLGALGFTVSTRTRRCPCILHGGSNPSAFSWRDDGRWYCHSCGAGGDRIALVRGVRQCGFHDAVRLLAELASAEQRAQRILCADVARVPERLERGLPLNGSRQNQERIGEVSA